MSILEEEVSILIPSYNNFELVKDAVESAINTKAGEIIISDDSTDTSVFQNLLKFNDSRIRLFKSPTQLGLWENHLKLLSEADKPWIKFLQQDDIICDGGLRIMCEAADDKTVLVGASFINFDFDTGETKILSKLKTAHRWTSNDYLKHITYYGNGLGNPSMTLIKKSALDLNVNAWRTDISADYIMNIIAPIHGDVVLLPPGPIIVRSHKQQDSQTASLKLATQRMANTLEYLYNVPNSSIKLHTELISFIEGLGFLRYAFGQKRRGIRIYKGFLRDWKGIIKYCKVSNLIFKFNRILCLLNTKYSIIKF